MELTRAQYERIARHLPKPRGSLKYSHFDVLNAILFIAENGAKWRRLPASLGHWHTVYSRMRAWAKSGVLARVFEALQQEAIVRVKVEVASLESTSIKVHPDAAGALKKTARRPSDARAARSTPRFIWLPQMRARGSAFPARADRRATERRGANP